MSPYSARTMSPLHLLLAALSSVAGAASHLPDDVNFLQDPHGDPMRKVPKTTAERIAEYGYAVETHDVVTEDGYILQLFRLPYSRKLQNQAARRPPVLIMHGLFSSSDTWVVSGPDDNLPFILVDAGFDVFIGNTRGNVYARHHRSKSPQSRDFWRFSWHEIGHYDLAAMVDHILAANGQYAALHYVGHSQGTTAMFVLLATRPEYNGRLKLANMLAPVAFAAHMTDKLITLFADAFGKSTPYGMPFNSKEFLPSNELFLKLAYNTCMLDFVVSDLCSVAAFLFGGNSAMPNKTALTYVASTHPAGLSTDQFIHFLQLKKSGCFCQYDFGRQQNMQVYGQARPFDYDLQRIVAPMHLWYSDSDTLADTPDVLKLAALLPNNTLHHVADPRWAHGDFTYGIRIREVINEPIKQMLLAYEQAQPSPPDLGNAAVSQ